MLSMRHGETDDDMTTVKSPLYYACAVTLYLSFNGKSGLLIHTILIHCRDQSFKVNHFKM